MDADAGLLRAGTEVGRVSVVVITRNRAEEVVRTVTNMRALPEVAHIMVVDNASEDAHYVLREVVAALPWLLGERRVVPATVEALYRTVRRRERKRSFVPSETLQARSP